jgi:hypothetical protein
MEPKQAKELIAQLKRIADALEKKNLITDKQEKRAEKLNKLQEKQIKSKLRRDNTDRISPNLETE